LLVAEVPWSEAGIASSKLEYLYRHGFSATAPRGSRLPRIARVLAQPFGDSGSTALEVPLDSAWPSTGWGEHPFEWARCAQAAWVLVDAARRCWSIEVRSLGAVQDDLAWLARAVYPGKSVELDLDEFDAKSRYSTREGRRTKLRTK
jgi:hypothetical protein